MKNGRNLITRIMATGGAKDGRAEGDIKQRR